MSLPTEQYRRSYQQNGYVVAPAIVDNTALEPVRRAIAETVDQLARQRHAEGQIDQLYADAPFEQRLAYIYQNGASKSMGWNREVFSKAIYDLLTHPNLLELAESLLGPEVTVNGDYWVRTKLPGERLTTLPWHQDSGYYGPQTAAEHILSVWLPLVDVDEHNGCMQFIPGSHRWGLLPTDKDEDRHNIPTEDVAGRGQVETLRMKVGDAVAFHNLTFHRSLMNGSDAIRWSIDLRYSPTGTPTEWLSRMGLFGFVARSRSQPETVEGWETWHARRAISST
ncbi:MAG TPA: phytanoyl-CoA dioxygenase family protein [Caldilineaceae bacterium]|nr:phytanoyl-CoA dioxygenase family protein [Caldilineaceae bacterium]